jgi:hypothetical protein
MLAQISIRQAGDTLRASGNDAPGFIATPD